MNGQCGGSGTSAHLTSHAKKASMTYDASGPNPPGPEINDTRSKSLDQQQPEGFSVGRWAILPRFHTRYCPRKQGLARAAPILLLVGFGLVNVRRLRRGGCAFVAAHSSSFPSLLFPSDSIHSIRFVACRYKEIDLADRRKESPEISASPSTKFFQPNCVLPLHNIYTQYILSAPSNIPNRPPNLGAAE